MNKSLIIGYHKRGDRVCMKIIKQTHRGREFGKRSALYEYNRVETVYETHTTVNSSEYPSFRKTGDDKCLLMVRSSDPDYDDMLFYARNENFVRFIVPAVVAYNNEFNNNSVSEKDVVIGFKNKRDLISFSEGDL